MVHKLFHVHLTDTGKLLFWVLLLSTSVSLFTFHLKAYVLWSGLIAVCFCSAVASRLARKKLDFTVTVPDRVRHGQEFHLEIDAFNPGKRPARDVRFRYRVPSRIDSDEPSFVEELGPGKSHRFRQTLSPKKRGAYYLSLIHI